MAVIRILVLIGITFTLADLERGPFHSDTPQPDCTGGDADCLRPTDRHAAASHAPTEPVVLSGGPQISLQVPAAATASRPVEFDVVTPPKGAHCYTRSGASPPADHA